MINPDDIDRTNALLEEEPRVADARRCPNGPTVPAVIESGEALFTDRQLQAVWEVATRPTARYHLGLPRICW